MSFRVRLTAEAEGDLDRLFDFVVERELQHDGGDLELAESALAAIRSGFATLKASPFTCRKADSAPRWLSSTSPRPTSNAIRASTSDSTCRHRWPTSNPGDRPSNHRTS